MNDTKVTSRRYSLGIAAFLFLLGVGMGLYAFGETEVVDRIDDFGLLAVGIIAMLWYLAGGSRVSRTVIPLALTLLALAVQILGVVLEFGDKASFGDNILGLVLLVPATLFTLWRHVRSANRIGAGAPLSEPSGAAAISRGK